jgi:hypothetical protein
VSKKSIFSCCQKGSNFKLLYLGHRCDRKALFSAFNAAWEGLLVAKVATFLRLVFFGGKVRQPVVAKFKQL